jgi:hypothetical protein
VKGWTAFGSGALELNGLVSGMSGAASCTPGKRMSVRWTGSDLPRCSTPFRAMAGLAQLPPSIGWRTLTRPEHKRLDEYSCPP